MRVRGYGAVTLITDPTETYSLTTGSRLPGAARVKSLRSACGTVPGLPLASSTFNVTGLTKDCQSGMDPSVFRGSGAGPVSVNVSPGFRTIESDSSSGLKSVVT